MDYCTGGPPCFKNKARKEFMKDKIFKFFVTHNYVIGKNAGAVIEHRVRPSLLIPYNLGSNSYTVKV